MTLVPHGEDSTPKVDALFKEIHSHGLKTLLLTNNDEARVKRFIKNIGTLYICDAEKHNPKNYLISRRVARHENNPTCYAISLQKEVFKRHIKNFLSKDKIVKEISSLTLPNVITDYNCGLIKKGPGIDPVLQENKAVNIELACAKLNGLVIHPGEIFSFWLTVGKTTKAKGYKDGRVIIKGKLIPRLGGGLCNLGNTIHYMV